METPNIESDYQRKETFKDKIYLKQKPFGQRPRTSIKQCSQTDQITLPTSNPSHLRQKSATSTAAAVPYSMNFANSECGISKAPTTDYQIKNSNDY